MPETPAKQGLTYADAGVSIDTGDALISRIKPLAKSTRRPGADVALLNAIMHVIVEEELFDQQYIEAYTENWPAMKEHLKGFPPEKMAAICGMPSALILALLRKIRPKSSVSGKTSSCMGR